MSVLLWSQAVVLVVGGYLVGVGYFRARWTIKVPPPKPCIPWTSGNVTCEGPASAFGVSAWTDPARFPVLHCRNCCEWASNKRAAANREAGAAFWPFALVGRVIGSVIGIGESLAGVESRALPRETPEAVEVESP